MRRALDHLGRGWPYPVAPGPDTRGLPLVEGPAKVRQSIHIILDTEPGERIMRPTFGCGLRRYLMKPNTTAVRALIQRDVERALRTWEPRIELQSVEVAPGDEPALIWIRIRYKRVVDSALENLVYPFYLE